MNGKSLHLPLPVLSLMLLMASVLVAQEPNSTPSASEQRAMAILKNMSEYLARAERFSVTIRDGYDAVQQSGQKIEYGEVRKVTVSRPDRLRLEVERSDGEKGLVAKITDRMRSRVARILQLTMQIPTDPPAPTAPGTAVVHLVLGVATTPDWQPLAQLVWR